MSCPRLRPRPTLHSVVFLTLLTLIPGLTGCKLGLPVTPRSHPPQMLHLAALFPTSGADGALGRAVQRGVALAVRQHVRLARGYRLALTRLNEASLSPLQMERVLRQQQVMGIVGPLESSSVLTLLPRIERERIPTVSLTPLLPGPTTSRAAQNSPAAEGPVTFFPLSATDAVAGTAAADLALAPVLGARAVFLAVDGTLTGRTVADAFAAELVHHGGTVAGRRSVVVGDPMETQRAVSAIIEASPDLVFYGGGTAAGAELRRTLSQTGAPLLRMLTAGSVTDNPGWAAAVGGGAISARTIGILPSPDLAAFPHVRQFASVYHHAFPGQVLLPQTVVAYDAAMAEIKAMKALIRIGKPVTRQAVGAMLPGSQFGGMTGLVSFGRAHRVRPTPLSLYTCGPNGMWQYGGTVRQSRSAG